LADLAEFQKSIGIMFQSPSLLATALTHSSLVNESSGTVVESNERLEFLGDAVLGFIIAEKLYQDFPGLSEGDMTRLRSALVRQDALARAAQSIRLGDFLDMGRGEEASGGRGRAANLAGALEAVIAAICLDRGTSATRDFVLSLLGEELARAGHQGISVDYKSKLQETMQARRQVAPTYRLVKEVGPDHDKRFTVEVLSGDKVLGRGSGKSKKLAESEAARLALERLAAGFTG
jgi:ribonuclease-3